jgi:hypothetical protein
LISLDCGSTDPLIGPGSVDHSLGPSFCVLAHQAILCYLPRVPLIFGTNWSGVGLLDHCMYVDDLSDDN